MSPTSGMAFQHTRIKENVAKHSNHVEHKEDIKVAEANRLQCLGTELSKDEIENPVRKCGGRISESANLDREDLSWIYPRDDTQRSIEEGEDKVHGDHGAKHVSVVGVEGLRHGGVADESCSKTSGGDDEGLDTTEALESPEADSAIDDGERTADTDDHKGSRVVDTQDLVDLGSYRTASMKCLGFGISIHIP